MINTLSRVFFFGALAASTTSCYQKHLVLQADVVSMTQTHAGETTKLRQVGAVSEKWCYDEDPVLDSPDKVYGLADQVIYKAQDGGKSADFITDVRIFRDTEGCALLEGNRAKI